MDSEITREDIIRMAREIATQCCNRMPSWQNEYAMSRIMELIDASAAAEREACAKVCEEWGAWNNVAQDCAAAIRERKDT